MTRILYKENALVYIYRFCMNIYAFLRWARDNGGIIVQYSNLDAKLQSPRVRGQTWTQTWTKSGPTFANLGC